MTEGCGMLPGGLVSLVIQVVSTRMANQPHRVTKYVKHARKNQTCMINIHKYTINAMALRARSILSSPLPIWTHGFFFREAAWW